jgi:uncharacterized membrane protein
MSNIEDSIEVEVPVRTVYNQWTQFEDFPRFMEGVKEVKQLDDKRLFWRAEIAGIDVNWNAEITHQEPDHLIAWRSTSGTSHAGGVTFNPVGPNKAKVTLSLDYDPEGFAENIAAALGIVKAHVHGDLARFKRFIESRGTETGAWRGMIAGETIQGGNPASN